MKDSSKKLIRTFFIIVFCIIFINNELPIVKLINPIFSLLIFFIIQYINTSISFGEQSKEHKFITVSVNVLNIGILAIILLCLGFNIF